MSYNSAGKVVVNSKAVGLDPGINPGTMGYNASNIKNFSAKIAKRAF
jgi:hypothetical protein